MPTPIECRPRGASQRDCGLRPVTRESRQVGSVLATLAAAQGAPAAPSSTRRSPAPIRLHECGRSTLAGAKASGSTSACAGRRHHVRQRVSRQQRAQLHGATCGCMLLEHPHKPSGSNPLQGGGPVVGMRMLLEHRSWHQRVAYPFDKALSRRPGSGLTQQWLTPVKPSHGGPAQA